MKIIMIFNTTVLSILLFGCSKKTHIINKQQPKAILHQPTTVSKNCNDGLVKIYDECSNQKEILAKELVQINKENKRVLAV